MILTLPQLSSRHRWLSIGIGIGLFFSLSLGTLIRPAAASDGMTEAPSQHHSPARSAPTTIRTISFVHVADIHAHYNPDANGSNPMGRIRGYYLQVKKENPFTFFTNAGDDYEKGSIAEELSHGRSTREVVRAMRYDVRTLGNHDFSWGIEEMLRFSHDPHTAVLATNTFLDQGEAEGRPAPGWTDFAVRTAGGVKIGFFGLVGRPWNEKNQQYGGRYYPDIPALRTEFNEVERTREIIKRYRKTVDILVLVSHLGLEDDIALAERTEGIDLILGGHTHTDMDAPLRVHATTIVHTGAFGRSVGRVDLDYDVQAGKIAATAFWRVANRPGIMPEDRKTTRTLAKILRRYEPALKKSITTVGHECDKQAMATLAGRAAMAMLKTDAALIDIGTVGPHWPRGQLTRQDILNGFKVERQPAGTPGQSSLYIMTVRGVDLPAAAALPNTVYTGPTRGTPLALYTLAVQKATALNQQEFFGKTISLTAPRPAVELWEALVAYASERRAAGLQLDDDGSRPTENLIALLQRTHDRSAWQDLSGPLRGDPRR